MCRIHRLSRPQRGKPQLPALLQSEGKKPCVEEQDSAETLHEAPATPSVLTPVKQRISTLERRNEKLLDRMTRLRTCTKKTSLKTRQQEAIKAVSEFLTGLSLQVVISLILLSSTKSTKRNCYSEETKLFLLSMYHSNPKAYRLLRCIFQLPCVSTLKSCFTSAVQTWLSGGGTGCSGAKN